MTQLQHGEQKLKVRKYSWDKEVYGFCWNGLSHIDEINIIWRLYKSLKFFLSYGFGIEYRL